MSEIKLHLGCGHRYLKGFIHVDKDNLDHIDYPDTDLGNLSMFQDNSVSIIYTCGSFEYYDREEAVGVLSEWRRVLKKNGILKTLFEFLMTLLERYFLISCKTLPSPMLLIF